MTETRDPLEGLTPADQSRFVGYLVSEILPAQDWEIRKIRRYRNALQRYQSKRLPDYIRRWAIKYRPRFDDPALRAADSR